MSRVLVPRGPTASSKIVSATDWCEYFGFLNNHVVCGLVVTAGCGLNVDIAAGNARVLGLTLDNTVSCCCAVCGGLSACMCNFIYTQVNNDCMSIPCNWTFTTNTTGCAPAQAMRIAVATTNCATVTAVCQAGPCNIEVRSGVCCPTIYGNGRDGNTVISTNTDLSCDNYKQYKNLTINACIELTGDSPLIIKVSCTLTLNACSTICVVGKGAVGGVPSNTPQADGGAGGGMLKLFAATITGTGIISANGAQGLDICCEASVNGCTDGGDDGQNDGVVDTGTGGGPGGDGQARGGGGGGAVGDGGVGGGGCPDAGCGYCPVVCYDILYNETTGGGGGSGNHEQQISSTGSGAGGGGGLLFLWSSEPLPAVTISADGGRGGNVTVSAIINAGGGGGGGGFVMTIGPDQSSATITACGGAGGITMCSITNNDGSAGCAGTTEVGLL